MLEIPRQPTTFRWIKLVASLALACWLGLRALPATAQSQPAPDSALQIEELKDKIAASPEDPDLRTKLGILYVNEELYSEARGEFLAALQGAPNEPASHMNLALVLLRLESWDEAKFFLQNYTQMIPTEADGYLRLGEAYQGAGELDTARNVWMDAARREDMPTKERVRLVRRAASTHGEAEEWQAADALLREDPELLRDAAAGDLRALAGAASIHLAKAAKAAGDADAALRHYAHARAVQPMEPASYGEPLEILLERHELDQASSLVAEAQASLAGQGAAAFFAGRLAQEKGDLQTAADELQEAVRLDPELPGAYAALGTVLGQLGDSAGASRALAQAVKRGQGGAAASYNMGVVLSQKGQFREAIPHLKTAVAEDESNKDAYRALGQAYKKVDDHRGMADIYQKLIDRFGPDPRDLFQLASAQAKLDQHSDAVDNYEMVVAIDPTNFAAVYNYANSLAKLGRHADAVEQFRAAIALQPDNEIVQYNIAFNLQKLGDYEGAIENYELALDLKETYRSYVNMAICFKELEDVETSDLYYAKAAELKKRGG